MAMLNEVRKGMQVYGTDNQLYGTVEDVENGAIFVNGRQLTSDMVSKVENGNVYVGQVANQAHVPVAEEQLNVGKRIVEQGAVQVHKTVTQEQVNVPVELKREEATLQKVDTPDRPLQAGENAFREQTFEMPLRAEEAVVNKRAVVTGEVVVGKEQKTQQTNVGDTVRRERVEVDRSTPNTFTTNYQAQTNSPSYANANMQGDYQSNAVYATSGQLETWTGGQICQGLSVYSADDDNIGRVKEVGNNEFLVDRKLQPDIYVPFNAVQNINGEQIILNVPTEQLNNMGWRNP